MKKVAIMTDSNSGLTPEQAAEMGVFVLPMPIIVDGRTYYENVDITPAEFYAKQRQGLCITTSQPSPELLMSMWDKLLQDYAEIVYIPMSSQLSNSCQSALLFSAKYGGRVQVVDNVRISVTQWMAVQDARLLAERGLNARQIKKVLEDEAHDATIYICVDTLTYLKKSGRVTPAAAAIGTALQIKPVLTIQGGKLDSYAKARGKKAAFRMMMKALRNDLHTRLRKLDEKGRLVLGMASIWMPTEEIHAWLSRFQAEFPGREIVYGPLTLSIGCHTGAGAFGIGAVRRHTLDEELPPLS